MDKKKSNSKNAFDTFGFNENFGNETRTSKNSTPTNTFGFEANFANFDAFNNNSSEITDNNGFNDAWGETVTKISKIKKSKDSEGKANKISKFSSDYSDNYEKDLEQVLKRSMMEQ